MNQAFISKLTNIVLAHLPDADFGVKGLAKESGLSSSSLNRRLRKITDKNINQFIREIRLKRALEMLNNEEVTASEVAFKVGFSSPAYFNTCFHEFFGYPPGKVKQILAEAGSKNIDEPASSYKGQKELARNLLIRILPLVIFLTAIIVVAVLLVYPKIFKRDVLADLRSSHSKISVAVLPFRNMTNDTSINFLQDWIQDIIISDLSNYYEELEVRQIETVRRQIQSKGQIDFTSVTPKIASSISRRLHADVFIMGNLNIAGSKLLLTAQIVDSKSRQIIRSFHKEGLYKASDSSPVVDSISKAVKDFLRLTEMKADNIQYRYLPTTPSPEAYKNYLYGDYDFFMLDFVTASEWFLEALKIDSNFVFAMAKLSYAYYNQNKYPEAKTWCDKAYEKRNLVSMQQKIYIDLLKATIYDPPKMEIKYARQLLKINDQLPTMYYRVGVGYNYLFQYEKAIPEFEKSIEINKLWGLKPDWVLTYIQLGIAYHKTGQFRKEKKLYRKARKDFPDGLARILYRQAVLSFTLGDTVKAEQYISKYKSNLTESHTSEPDIASGIASVYKEAGILDKAEKYYRQALLLEPSNPVRLNNLAYLLIDKGMDINEGLALSEQALELDPDNYISLDCMGWGFYKQGKQGEAIDFLERSWNLKPVYVHRIFLHLEEVKKSLALSDKL